MSRPLFPQICTGREFAAELARLATLSTGVPDSVTKAVLPLLPHYHPAPGEEHALALAFGARAGGGRPVVLMQNSGLGRCLDALLGLQKLYGVGLALVVVNRGELDWEEPQHQDWGDLTEPLLELLELPVIDFTRAGLPGLEQCIAQAYDGEQEKVSVLLLHRGNIDESA